VPDPASGQATPYLVGNADIVIKPEATTSRTNIWVQAIELGQRDVKLGGDLSTVVSGNDLVPLLAILVHVGLSRRGDIAGGLRRSGRDGLRRSSVYTNADVVTKPEASARVTDRWIPFVEVLQGEGAILRDDGLALVAGHNLMIALAIGCDALLDWARGVGGWDWGCGSGGLGSGS
jgi:hypothetical protein